MLNSSTKIILITLFSIAMGYMEAVIVVYLRALYYPAGFNFPLIPMDNRIIVTELFRETATIIMLLLIGILTGRGTTQKFVYFLYAFAIWDIFYYVFLKVLINWPDSLFTWDILFLIPVPWVGPVIAPVILSITIILLTLEVLLLNKRNYLVTLNFRDWLLLISGSLVIIISFTIDYLRIIMASQVNTSSNMLENLHSFIPVSYNWWLFAIGEMLILFDLILIYLKRSKYKTTEN
ncbi:MAG: hypothetical protein ACM3PX_06205 [Omnitrophica WOR_2 bacterium]